MANNDWAAPYKTVDGLSLSGGSGGINTPEPANTFYAGPSSGAAGAPTFRTIMASDLPGGTPLFGGFSTNGAIYANSTTSVASTATGANGTVLVSNGSSTAPSFSAIDLTNSASTSGALPINKGGTGTSSSVSGNAAFIGPVFGSGAPSFRSIGLADLPSGDTIVESASSTGAQYIATTMGSVGAAIIGANLTPTYAVTAAAASLGVTNAGLAQTTANGAALTAGTALSSAIGSSADLAVSTGSGKLVRQTGGNITLGTPLPVTSGGTGTASTTQNFVLAGPTSGSGAPTFRLLTAADVPSIGTPSFTGLTTGGAMFATSTTAIGSSSSVYINSTQIGIGAVPTSNYSLDITNSVTGSNLPQVRIANTAGGAGNKVGINITPFSGRTGGDSTSIQALDDGLQSAHLILLTASQGSGTTLTERMRVSNNGQVSVGTTTVAKKFNVVSSDTTDVCIMQNTNSLGYATTLYQNDTSATLDIGVGGSTTYLNFPYISSSTNTLQVPSTLSTASTNLALQNVTATTVQISSGTSNPFKITTSYPGDSIQVATTSTINQASIKLTNDTFVNSYWYQTSSMQVGSPNQTGILPSANGLKIGGNVSMGSQAVSAPSHPLTINYSDSTNSIDVTSSNSTAYNSIQFHNDTGATAEFGVGGSGVGATQDQNNAFISANSLQINCPVTINGGVHSLLPYFASNSQAYKVGGTAPNGYYNYPLGDAAFYFFDSGGFITNYLPGSITYVAGSGTNQPPYYLVPYQGIYQIQWVLTTSPYFSPGFITVNNYLSNSVNGVGPNWNGSGIIAYSDGWGDSSTPGATPGTTINVTYRFTPTDKIYFGIYESNAAQGTQQPGQAFGGGTNHNTYWRVTFTMIQRTG